MFKLDACKYNFYLYTFILNTVIKNHTFRSLTHLSIYQCQTAWKIWNKDKWDECLYDSSKTDQDTGKIWNTEPNSELDIPLFVVDYSIYLILMILLLIGAFKINKLYVFFEAWNHYQQSFMILCFTFWSGNSSNVMKTLSFTLAPYFTLFAFLRILNMEYIWLEWSNKLFDFKSLLTYENTEMKMANLNATNSKI